MIENVSEHLALKYYKKISENIKKCNHIGASKILVNVDISR